MSGKTPIIGLAGGIGSGKSLVAQMMNELGARVLDADLAAHRALADPDVVASLLAWWGPSVVDADGRVDRERVAEIVFEAPAERRRLEALIHPRIFAEWAETFQQCRDDPAIAAAIVIDAALLFEAGLDESCDAIVFVDTPEDARAERVMETRGWSLDEWRRREKMQKPLDGKRAGADHIVENSSSVSDLRQRVKDVFSAITS